MKKRSLVALVTVALMICLTFVSCGKSKIIGEWEFDLKSTVNSALTAQPGYEDLSDSDIELVKETVESTFAAIEFNVNFKDETSVEVEAFGEKAEGEYTVDDAVVAVTIDGETLEFKYNGKNLVVEEDGIELFLFKK